MMEYGREITAKDPIQGWQNAVASANNLPLWQVATDRGYLQLWAHDLMTLMAFFFNVF